MSRIVGLMAALVLGLASAPVLSQSNYPDKPIHIMVGFLAGVAPDVTSRLMGDKFNQTWAKGVMVENVLGAGGNIAVDRTRESGARRLHAGHGRQRIAGHQSQPDGQAVVRSAEGLRLHHAGFYRAESPGGARRLARPEHPGSDQRSPRRSRTISLPDTPASAPRSISAGELFKKMAGVQMQQVAYRGTPGVLPDLLGGRLNVFFGNISNCLPLVREGKLRAFAVTSKKRSPQIPELPTMEELGFPGFEATAWFGLMAPAGTPQPIIDKLHGETVKVLAMPDVRSKLESLGLQLVGNYARGVCRGGQGRNPGLGQGHQGRRNFERAIGWQRGTT